MKSNSLNNKKSIQIIYIPILLKHIRTEFIKETFEYQNIGIVSHIDLIKRKHNNDSNNSNMAFVHISNWCNNPISFHIADELKNKKNNGIKISYNQFGDYWILLPFNKKASTKNGNYISKKQSNKTSLEIENKRLKKDNKYLINEIRNLNEKISIMELELIDAMDINDMDIKLMPPPPVLKRQTAGSYDNLPILENNNSIKYDSQPPSPQQSLVTQEDEILFDNESEYENELEFEWLDDDENNSAWHRVSCFKSYMDKNNTNDVSSWQS